MGKRSYPLPKKGSMNEAKGVTPNAYNTSITLTNSTPNMPQYTLMPIKVIVTEVTVASWDGLPYTLFLRKPLR